MSNINSNTCGSATVVQLHMNQTQRRGFGSFSLIVLFGSGSVVKLLGSFGSVRNGLKVGFEFGVFGSGSVRFLSLADTRIKLFFCG